MTAPAAASAPGAPRSRDRGLRETLSELGPVQVARLALPPAWTQRLALLSGLFGDEADLSRFLERCESVNWCARRSLRYSVRPATETAELLVSVTTALVRAGAPAELVNRAASTAADRLAGVGEAERTRLGTKLAGDRAALAAAGPAVAAMLARLPEPSATPAAPTADPAQLATLPPGRLAAAATSAAAELPADQLSDLVHRCVQEAEPQSAAQLLSTAAPRLPSADVREQVDAIAARVTDDGPADQAALSHLATAAASGDAVERALDLAQGLQSERLKARTLASVAAVLVGRPEAAPRLQQVVDRLVRALSGGSDVDLPGTADAVQRLTAAGEPRWAEPLLRMAETAIRDMIRRGSEVGALVRLASASAAAGTGEQADRFGRAALEAARAEGDPLIRASALLQLPLTDGDGVRSPVLLEALAASRLIVDDDQRADLLARLVPHLEGDVRAEALDELLALCATDDSRYAFWMPDAARKEVLPILGEPDPSGVSGPAATPVYVPAATRRWATLAAELDDPDATGERAGELLLTKVGRLLRSSATAEALRWVESARQLVPVVRGTFETSVLTAERRIEVEQRHQEDRRQLHRFLRRDEQVTAFKDLLAAPDDGPWALHYLGHGGVGKTMLLRFITAELASGRGVLTARVDFDRLSPEFPLGRPGQLLLDLLTDLEAYAVGDLRTDYRVAQEKLLHLEWWADSDSAARDLDRATRRFCDFLGQLKQPVLLILDTCEELTRYQPHGYAVPRLDAAFHLLERIHDAVPSVRVVLAGRRPLAASGAGWELDPERLPAVPARKDYLAVHEVLGFTEDEAVRYLRTVEDLPLDDAGVLKRLLTRCLDPHTTAFFGHPDGADRYGPFDLALTAIALRDDPRYADAMPTEDVYVEARVRRRLGERWDGLLAAVTLLRRFDRTMLSACVPAEDLDDAWRELRSTEWITSSFDSVLQTTFLEVDPGLQRRLESYFARPAHVQELDRVRLGLGAALDRLIRTSPPAQLGSEAVEAALRTLDPDAGARLVDQIGLDVARRNAWMWAHTVFSGVLGPEGALADPDLPARSGALLAYLTAHRYVRRTGGPRGQWREVAARAGQHPDPGRVDWLRAVAGVHAYPVDEDAVGRGLELARATVGTEPERAVWLLGTCLSVLEAAGPARPVEELEQLAGLAPAIGRDRPGLTALVLAEAAAVAGPVDRERQQHLLRAALDAAAAAGPAPELAEFLSAEWSAPKLVRERVRLQAASAGLVRDRDQWLREALAAGPAQDGYADRLAGTLLDGLLSAGLVPEKLLEAAVAAVGDAPPPPLAPGPYAQLPPLRVALSRGWLALGRGDRAVAALGRRGRFGRTAADQLLLDTARVDVARRLRLEEQDRKLRTSLCTQQRPSAVPRVVEAAGLLDGTAPPLPTIADPADVHVIWRVTPAPEPELVERLAELSPGAAGTLATRLGLALDAYEAQLMDLPGAPVSPAGDVERHLDSGRLDPETAGRLLLRQLALRGRPPADWDAALEPVSARVGRRRLAELALEEGELLALRLPDQAEALLARSATWFRRAADPVGGFLATVGVALAAERRRAKPDTQALDAALREAAAVAPALPRSLAELVKMDPAALAGSDWSGWLVRIAALERNRHLGRAESRTTRGYSSPELVVGGQRPDAERDRPESPWWGSPTLRSRGSADVDVQSAVPPVGPPPAPGAAPTTGPRAPGGARWRHLRTGLAVVLGGAVALAAVWLSYRGFSAGMTAVWPDASLAVRLPVFLAALALLWWMSVRVLESGPTVNRLDVEVVLDRGRPTVTASGYRQRRWPLPARRARAELAVRIPPSGSVRAEPGKAGTLGSQLLRLAHARAPLTVAVRTPLEAVGQPWEDFLTGQLGELGPLRIHRSYIRSRNVHHSGPVRVTGRLLYGVPPEWRPLLDSLRPSGRDGPVRPEPLSQPDQPGAGDIVVVVGVPVDAAVGLRLVVPGLAELEPDALTLERTVVVVAGLPRHGGGDRAADLATVEDLRRCAADLVVAGADYAVVLPSLPAAVLGRCLVALQSALVGADLLYPLVVSTAVAAVREVVLAAEPGTEPSVTELHAQR